MTTLKTFIRLHKSKFSFMIRKECRKCNSRCSFVPIIHKTHIDRKLLQMLGWSFFVGSSHSWSCPNLRWVLELFQWNPENIYFVKILQNWSNTDLISLIKVKDGSVSSLEWEFSNIQASSQWVFSIIIVIITGWRTSSLDQSCETEKHQHNWCPHHHQPCLAARPGLV